MCPHLHQQYIYASSPASASGMLIVQILLHTDLNRCYDSQQTYDKLQGFKHLTFCLLYFTNAPQIEVKRTLGLYYTCLFFQNDKTLTLK